MAYKVNSTRLYPGRYRLTYGKGKKKLTSDVYQCATGWRVDMCHSGDLGLDQVYATKENAKTKWGRKAREFYETPSSQPSTTVVDGGDHAGEHCRDSDTGMVTIFNDEPDGPVRPPIKQQGAFMNYYDKMKFESLCEIYGTEFMVRQARQYGEVKGI